MPDLPFTSDFEQKIANCLAEGLGTLSGFAEIAVFGSLVTGEFESDRSDLDVLFVFEQGAAGALDERIAAQQRLGAVLVGCERIVRETAKCRKKLKISPAIVTRLQLEYGFVKKAKDGFLESANPVWCLKSRQEKTLTVMAPGLRETVSLFFPVVELVQLRRAEYARDELKGIKVSKGYEDLKSLFRTWATFESSRGVVPNCDFPTGLLSLLKVLHRFSTESPPTMRERALDLKNRLLKLLENNATRQKYVIEPLDMLGLCEFISDEVARRMEAAGNALPANASTSTEVPGLSGPIVVDTRETPAALLDPVLEAYCVAVTRNWNLDQSDSTRDGFISSYQANHLARARSDAELKPGGQPRQAGASERADDDGDTYHRLPRLCDSAHPTRDELFEKFLSEGQPKRRWLVVEDAGAGKSVFTRSLQAWLSAKGPGGGRGDNPPPLVVRWEGGRPAWPAVGDGGSIVAAFQAAIVVKLRDWLRTGEGEAAPYRHLTDDILRGIVELAWREDRVVLLLDAFDQVASDNPNQPQANQRQALFNLVLESKVPIVVTSRPSAVESSFDNQRWCRLVLLGFTPPQQVLFLQRTIEIHTSLSKTAVKLWSKVCAAEGLDEKTAKEVLADPVVFGALYPQVENLLRVPALLAFVRDLAEARQSFPQFANRADLYWQAINSLFRRESRVLTHTGEGLAEFFTGNLHLHLLACVGYHMICRHGRAYQVTGGAVDDLKAEVWKLLRSDSSLGERVRTVEQWDKLWSKAMKVAPWTRHLVVEQFAEQVFGFKHRGMQEFFAGLYLARLYDAGRDEAQVAPQIGNSDWFWPLRFAAELRSANDAEAQGWVRKSAWESALGLAFETSPKVLGEHLQPNELRWHLLRAAHQAGGDLEARCRARLHAGFRQLVTNGELREAREAVRLLPLEVLRERCESWRLPAERVVQLLANTSAENWVECPPRELEKDSAQHQKWLLERSVAGEEEVYWFWQGSAKGTGYEPEQPRHARGVRRFWLQATAVTVDQYALFDRRYKETYAADLGAKARAGDCPAIAVSWYDGVMYAMWVGGGCRLPTESEWEFACRAGHDNPEDLFSLGRGASAELRSGEANFDGNYPKLSRNQGAGSVSAGKPPTHYVEETLPVRWDAGRREEWAERSGKAKPPAYEANEWGLWQMHGNVWEWCVDVHEEKAYENRASGASAGKVVGEVRVEADDAAEAQLYTVGPSRVLRGGSWFSLGVRLRCASRHWFPPDVRYHGVGLRLSWES